MGLFVARVALEATRHPWSGVMVVALGWLAALGGLALGRWLAVWRPACGAVGGRVRLWPALLLVVYVLWPRRDPVAAASVAVLAGLVWLLGGERTSLPRWGAPVADGATFVVALIAYVATAAPDVLPADAGEFQLVAALLGVAHPPGFPLYTLVGHVFVRLFPWGTPAYRLNLLSGLLAGGTLVLVARAVRLWAGRLGARPGLRVACGVAAAVALGTATTFWAQATIANVRTPAVFFAALALYGLARFASATSRQQADGALLLLGLALGLGLCHYPPLFFVALFFVGYLVLVDPRLVVQPRRWWRPVLAGLSGFLPLAYLPIQGAREAPLAPEGLDTLAGFLHHFLARGFAGDMFAFATAEALPHRLALLPTLFPFQFNLLLLAGALLGLLGLLQRDWRLFVLLAGSLVLHTFVSITYRAPQTVEYLMPAYLPVAIGIGLLPCLLSTFHIRVSACLCALLIWAGLLNGWAHGPSFVELAGDYTARRAAQPLLETAPAGSLILADWRWAMPLRYLQQVEGLRRDVEVRYVYPVAGEDYSDVWLHRIEEADPGTPVLSTHFYQFDGYTTEPWETGFLIRPRPVTQPQASLVPVGSTFGGQVRLVGYSLRERGFSPGQTAEFVLAWQPVGALESPPSFTLRLVDGEGRHVAQADRALGSGAIPGEVRFERLVLPLYPMLPPGHYQVRVGAYIVTGAGFETLPPAEGETEAVLTDLDLVPRACHLQSANQRTGESANRQLPLFTLHRLSVPFVAGPELVGVDYDRSVSDVLRVYLHWRGPIEAGWQARVRAAGGAEAAAPLPSLPAGACQTVAVDVQSPGEGGVWLSLVDERGHRARAAGPWGWSVGQVRLPIPVPDARFVPLGDEMAVIGATARSAAPGEAMAVDVKLVALRSLTSDDATSVRLSDGEGHWLATHDCQPGLGAVPTLKWIRGSRVTDRHLLPLPEDLTAGEVQATLVAYERFRMTSLPPMDGRFDQVPLGAWALP